MVKEFKAHDQETFNLIGYYDQEKEEIFVALTLKNGTFWNSTMRRIVASAYIATELGYKSWEDDDHWALYLYPKAGKRISGIPNLYFFDVDAKKIAQAKKRFERYVETIKE